MFIAFGIKDLPKELCNTSQSSKAQTGQREDENIGQRHMFKNVFKTVWNLKKNFFHLGLDMLCGKFDFLKSVGGGVKKQIWTKSKSV